MRPFVFFEVIVSRHHTASLAFLCLAVAALALWGYLPGLHGDFLFDDFANLPALGNYGHVTSWDVFWRYITSGEADPTGRPIALLSFLLDARDWPAQAYPFKRTNVAIHLANGMLLGLLLYRLGCSVSEPSGPEHQPETGARLALAGALSAALWLLHPLFVSTTLYIVQREAMLPATFTFLGLLLWLDGRSRLWRGQIARGLACMAAGLVGCTVLAMLSKANGILLPSLALAVEYTLMRPTDTSRYGLEPTGQTHARVRRLNNWALALLAWPTAVAVVAYLVWQGWTGWHAGASALRPWTLPQRLLTEPRVLFDYLTLLWMPRPFTPGVFNDHILASHSLLQPPSTVLALLGLFLLATVTWRLRRRWPAFALAVCFYFVGQVLESSTVALELFFEHRNYLPSALMFWPLALWLCGISIRLPAKNASPALRVVYVAASTPADQAKAALALVLLGGLAVMTHARATVWGNSRDQALLWATLNPASPRAQAYAAQAEMAAGEPLVAARRLQVALDQAPDDVQLALNLLAARCQAGHLDAATLETASRALASSRDSGSLLANWFQRVIAEVPHPACPELGADAVRTLLQAARANPLLTRSPGRRQDLLSLQGQVDLVSGDAAGALVQFKAALDQQVHATTAFKQAAILASAGHPTEALAELDYYDLVRGREALPGWGMPRLHAWVLQRQHYWNVELAHLRNTLRTDQRTQGNHRR